MSRLTSPHPPVRIIIDVDEMTGNTSSLITKNGAPYHMALLDVVLVFAQLISQYIVNSQREIVAREKAGQIAGESPLGGPADGAKN